MWPLCNTHLLRDTDFTTGSLAVLLSDYTGKQQCAPSELVSFNAYSTDTCFGYGTYSSTYFTYNATSSTSPHLYRSLPCTW